LGLSSLLFEGGETAFLSTTPNETKTVRIDAMTMRKIKKDAFAKALDGERQKMRKCRVHRVNKYCVPSGSASHILCADNADDEA
jgi:hypothetical protein